MQVGRSDFECGPPGSGDTLQRVDDLDVQAIIFAIAAIGSELIVTNVIKRLLLILLRNAGAHRATLLSRRTRDTPSEKDDHESEWQIDAMMGCDDLATIFMSPQYEVRTPLTEPSESVNSASEPAEAAPHADAYTSHSGASTISLPASNRTAVAFDISEYPRSILNFVLHSQKSVILADAVNDAVFGSDPCIRRTRTKSILCLPLVLRKSLVSVLYLEHPTTPAAFTRDRLLCCR
jgi:GAF domain-containing protein